MPILVVATHFTLSVGPPQSIFAYRLAEPSIRRRWSWFLLYCLASSLFYTELKNMITRVAKLKELMGERALAGDSAVRFIGASGSPSMAALILRVHVSAEIVE